MTRGRARLRTPTTCLLAMLAAWGSWRAASSLQFVPISGRAPAHGPEPTSTAERGAERGSWTQAAVAGLLVTPTAVFAEDGGDWFDPFVSLNANIIEAIDSVIGSAGAAIILYTILVKVVTYPLQQPALRASALLQMLSPQLEEINRQYKDDEDKKGQTLRDLYGKVGLNPFLSLVPVLFQIPLFVALFRAIGRLASQDDHFKEPFLWIPSLAGPVSQGKPSLDWLLKTRSSEAFEPLVGWQDATMYCVLPLLVFLAQFLSSRLSSSSSENSTNGVLFPLFIGISTLVSPSGVGVYWFTNTVLTTAQMKVTQDEVAEEFPEYKQIKDDFDAKEVSQQSSNSAEPSVAQDGGTGGTAQPSEAMASNFGSSGSLGEGSDIPSASSKTSNPQDGVNQLMPFKRQKTRDNGTWGLQRRKTQAMEDYLNRSQSLEEVPADAKGPQPVTPDNIAVNLRVQRGPDWQRGQEDGGAGKVGVILSFDTTKMTAQVLWEGSGKAHSHYQYGKSKELVLYAGSNSTLATAPLGRRNSQAFFADKAQTLLIFDWDDTLFPTTYVRDDLDLSWNKPLKDQSLTWAEKAEVGKKLDQCAAHVVELLKSACSFGKVVLVTLARAPWVSESCKNFYVSVGRLINQLKVPIVYAQEGIQVDYNKSQMTSDEEIERFWSAVKGKAIARECRQFYSQYEGQSWKNVISIGDSDFERLGTQSAMEDYMKERGIEQDGQLVDVGGHMYKVRTKTFKMVDEPTIEELTVEVEMLKAWLPLMVKLDSSFDVNLNNADDPEVLQSIEKTLRGETAH